MAAIDNPNQSEFTFLFIFSSSFCFCTNNEGTLEIVNPD